MLSSGIIVVPGNPVSVNSAYRRMPGRYGMFLAAEARGWKESVAWAAKTDWKKPMLFGRVAIEIILYYADFRRRDIDNSQKLIFDGLAGIVYRDDSQIDDIRIVRRHDKKKPRVEITAREI